MIRDCPSFCRTCEPKCSLCGRAACPPSPLALRRTWLQPPGFVHKMVKEVASERPQVAADKLALRFPRGERNYD